MERAKILAGIELMSKRGVLEEEIAVDELADADLEEAFMLSVDSLVKAGRKAEIPKGVGAIYNAVLDERAAAAEKEAEAKKKTKKKTKPTKAAPEKKSKPEVEKPAKVEKPPKVEKPAKVAKPRKEKGDKTKTRISAAGLAVEVLKEEGPLTMEELAAAVAKRSPNKDAHAIAWIVGIMVAGAKSMKISGTAISAK